MKKTVKSSKKILTNKKIWTIILCSYILILIFFTFFDLKDFKPSFKSESNIQKILSEIANPEITELNKELYDLSMIKLANIKTNKDSSLWPASSSYPNDGAVLPSRRIVAFYGNFLSKQMGVLGEYPESEMFERLNTELKKWNDADPETPAIPALQYIAVTAQGRPGEDGKYRLRMPDEQIEKAIEMAKKINALVILDIQIGQSTIQNELPLLEKYLKLPQVHLAIDPEFSMKFGRLPGIYVGTYDASEINYVTDYLAKIVKENRLTPKVFVVHRYTKNMVTNLNQIKTVPEVQIIMDMDGWGPKSGKIATYKNYIYPDPVQFTGFKLFYKNDLWKPSTAMMTPSEILELTPKPIYIQYQ